VLGFMARLLVQTTLPHSRQASKTFVRTNGALKVSVSAHPLLELPYGRYPRLLMAWSRRKSFELESLSCSSARR